MESGRTFTWKHLLAVLGGLLLVIYLLYHLLTPLKPEAELYTVRPATAGGTIELVGCLFREETVLTVRSQGFCHSHYRDGDKVAAGKPLCSIYRFGGAEVRAQIESYQKQIEIYSRSAALGMLTKEEVNERIDSLTYRISEKNAAGDTTAAATLSEELLVLMAKKDLLESGKTNYETEILLLEGDLARLIASLGVPVETVSSPVSGYYYRETDGYETIFTSEIAEELTLAEFDRLTALPPQTVTNAVGTLVTSAKWYYAAKVTRVEAESFLIGSSYDCFFKDNAHSGTVKMKLIRKDIGEKETLLVFSSSTLPTDFDMSRRQRAELTVSDHKGLRIPAECVRVSSDGVPYVYILKEGSASMREIEILYEQNGYFIVSASFEGVSELPNLKLNDLIILDDEDLYEGKFIDE